MNNISERHHYIPKFYALGFLDKDNKFYVYDKQKDSIRKKKVSTKEIFYEWNRNTVSSEKGSTDAVEGYYSQLDSECANLIQTLRNKPNEKGILTEETISLLRFFVINLFWRIPKTDFAATDYLRRTKITFIDNTNKVVEKPELEETLKSDPNYLKSIRPKVPLETINLAKPKKGSAVAQLFDFKEDMFLIGDYPIVFNMEPSGVDDLLNGDYLFPISSKRIYRFTEKKMELSFSLQNACAFNALLIEQSEHYVCGPDKDFLEKSIKYWKTTKSVGIFRDLPKTLF